MPESESALRRAQEARDAYLRSPGAEQHPEACYVALFTDLLHLLESEGIDHGPVLWTAKERFFAGRAPSTSRGGS